MSTVCLDKVQVSNREIKTWLTMQNFLKLCFLVINYDGLNLSKQLFSKFEWKYFIYKNWSKVFCFISGNAKNWQHTLKIIYKIRIAEGSDAVSE